MLGSLVRHKTVLVIALALLAGLLPIFVAGKPAHGAGKLPSNDFKQSQVAAGLSGPTAMEFAPDGRLFVAEVGGKLRVIKDGELLEEPFVDISTFDQIDSRGGRGLLGVAFDPKFGDPANPGNDYVYLHYTQKASDGGPSHNRVVRVMADTDNNPDVALAGSNQDIFEMDDLGNSPKHNGGAIHFGNDGMLYIAVGDNKRNRTAQSMNTVLGKMLRVEPDGDIPPDNPFYDPADPEDKNGAIWAMGFRNPYTFAVQPGTGKIHINDVGQQRWEEINVGEAGANYGWPFVEGPRDSRFTEPIFAYRHGSGPTTGCAITGGAFYNPPQDASSSFPDGYLGDYFFADFCTGWIRVLDADGEGVSPFATGVNLPVDLKVSQDGSLYYLELGSGSVNKIQPSATAAQ